MRAWVNCVPPPCPSEHLSLPRSTAQKLLGTPGGSAKVTAKEYCPGSNWRGACWAGSSCAEAVRNLCLPPKVVVVVVVVAVELGPWWWLDRFTQCVLSNPESWRWEEKWMVEQVNGHEGCKVGGRR